MNLSSLKKRTLNFICKPYFPLIVFGIIVFVLHLIIDTNYGDDLIFMHSLDEMSLTEFLKARYLTWSSRIFIEAILVTLVKMPILWKLLDTFLCILIIYTLSKLFAKKNILQCNIIICCLFLMYPFLHMNTAGWMATTINYLWPLGFGLFSFLPIKKVFNGDKFRIWEYPFYSIALFYGANLEQMSAIIFGIYLSFTLFFFLKKKSNVYIWLQTAFSFLSLLLIMLSPGNKVRYQTEVDVWFPDFNQLSFFRKLEMGFSSTLFHYIMTPNVFFGVFCTIVFFFICIKFKDRLHRTIGFIPVFISFVFGVFGSISGGIFPGIANTITSLTDYGTGILLTSIKSWGPDFILCLTCIPLLYCVYHIFDDRLQGFFAVYILIVGFCSRLIIGFTPTIWGSGERTYLFMYVSIIIVFILFYNQIANSNNKKHKETFENIIFIATGLSFLNTFFLIH